MIAYEENVGTKDVRNMLFEELAKEHPIKLSETLTVLGFIHNSTLATQIVYDIIYIHQKYSEESNQKQKRKNLTIAYQNLHSCGLQKSYEAVDHILKFIDIGE